MKHGVVLLSIGVALLAAQDRRPLAEIDFFGYKGLDLAAVRAALAPIEPGSKIDGRLSDIFGLQDRIVFELTQDLNLTLEASAINQIQQPETRSVEAYELYSRGVLSLRVLPQSTDKDDHHG